MQYARKLEDPFIVDVAKDGVSLEGKIEGQITGVTKQGTQFEMKSVVYLPELRGNLLSVKRLSKAGIDVLFTNDGREKAVLMIKGSVIAVAYLKNNLYELELNVNIEAKPKKFKSIRNDEKKCEPLMIPVRYQQEREDEDDYADNGIKADNEDSDDGAVGGTLTEKSFPFGRRNLKATKRREIEHGAATKCNSDDDDCGSQLNTNDNSEVVRPEVMLAVNISKRAGRQFLCKHKEQHERNRSKLSRGITLVAFAKQFKNSKRIVGYVDRERVLTE